MKKLKPIKRIKESSPDNEIGQVILSIKKELKRLEKLINKENKNES